LNKRKILTQIKRTPMDKDDAIEQLTAQLWQVSIRLAQLEAAAGREDNGSSAGTAAAPSSAKTTAAPIIKKGDRVHIANTVNKPRSWNDNLEWDQVKAQKATVTHFYRGQEHFVTDNGV
jgi:hypothetical protein